MSKDSLYFADLYYTFWCTQPLTLAGSHRLPGLPANENTHRDKILRQGYA
jgi:hypothetical protein